MAWKQDVLQHPCHHLCLYLPAVCPAQADLIKSAFFDRALVGSGGTVVTTEEWFVDLLSLLIDEPLELPQVWNLLVQPHVLKFHRGLEVTQHLVRKAGFSLEWL